MWLKLLVTFVPAIVLLVIQTLAKLDWKAPLVTFPDVGIDAHVVAVALSMSVTIQATSPRPPFDGSSLIISHLVVLFSLTAMLVATALAHHAGNQEACNRIGLFFLAVSMIWVFAVITQFTQ